MKIFTKKEKIAELIAEQIIPLAKNYDLDYEETINAIMQKTMASRNVVEDSIRLHIPRELKEIHILTLPDENIGDWLENVKKKEKRIDKEIKEITDAKVI